ncbi:N-alpha-acetyltransferase 40 [Golovinomyces cichoracearum]|uniref:N-alpha-acetyltransferase 40 n=1 Tax=Golovinomyces cichoracearum TaxID=62708 RepID=A0A420IZN8_9PEZI|nr:N-alpha-acetyltransferase 40 [Golovinomyces cichoracearum]
MDIDPIVKTNSKSKIEFQNEYFPPYFDWQTWVVPQTNDACELTLESSSTLSDQDLQSCFRLLEHTSSDHYKNSTTGWKPNLKKDEMRLPDMKYVVVKYGEQLEGFMSFMPIYEDGFPVLYCYEIHLSVKLQGLITLSRSYSIGLGVHLMKLLESIAIRILTIKKIMLTCFTQNTRAMEFYRKMGYDTDPFSPPARQLRNGTIFGADYVILSKVIRRP